MRTTTDAAAGGDLLDPAQVRRVRAVLALGGVPGTDLADGLQQVRLRLLERRAKGAEMPRDTGAWAAAVASNIAVDWHRSRTRQERLGARLTALPTWGDGARSPEDRLLTLVVADGLDALADLHRQVVVLRFYADLSVPQIAEALGIPAGTVKSRLHTAMRTLRQRLTETEEGA
ncbi:RNA polymerase sigma factor [Streptomyces sp. NPDC087440]|uniref:RNA polymerase sigma factor n=1 Tax=Streptomyces sp. NPDC087440 TaxID=3365790 RepID=UPI00381E4A98